MLSTFGNENGNSSARGCPPGRPEAPRIRAIVPFLDEEELLGDLLEQLRRSGVDRLVAVDGGSRDRSPAIAHRHADEVLRAAGGLAQQLNRGATTGDEEVLLFVHADSVLPSDLRASIETALLDPRCIGGAFPLSLDPSRPLLRWLSRGANLRTRLGLGPFGDQGIFVRRALFCAIGGYREDRILEDLDLVQRLRRHGRFRIVGSAMGTSSRRWDRHGLLVTTARHWWALGQHLVGVPRIPGVPTELDQIRTGGR